MSRAQIYKATQTGPLVLKQPHDPSSKLYYEFDYGATTDSDGNTLTPVINTGDAITASTWTISPASSTTDNSGFTDTVTKVRVTSLPANTTSFTLTNHITITRLSGDVEEDERSIIVTVADR